MHRIKTNMKKEIIYIIHVFFTVIMGILLLLYSFQISLSQLQWLMILIFVENCLLSLTGNFFSLYQLFLGTSFLFAYARIFLDALGYCDFRVQNLPASKGYLGEQDARILLITLILFLLSTSLAALIYLMLRNKLDKESKYYFDNRKPLKVLNILQNVYYLLIGLCIIKTGIVIQQVIKNGYGWLFNGGVQSYPFPFFLRVQTLTSVIFPVLLFYDRKINRVRQNMLLYMIYLGVRLFTGQRGQTFVSLLLLLWIYSTYYKRMRLWIVGIIGVISLFIIQYIREFRGTASAVNSVLYAALYSQGISVLVTANVIRFLGVFKNKYPFIIGYFVDWFSAIFNPAMNQGQNMERINHGNYLGDHLIYLFSPERYLSGSGTGTSIIAEFYEFVNGNLILFFGVSFLFMLIVLFVAHKLYKNIFYFVFLYHILYYFIYSPRDSIFKSFGIIMMSLPIVITFKLIEQKGREGS